MSACDGNVTKQRVKMIVRHSCINFILGINYCLCVISSQLLVQLYLYLKFYGSYITCNIVLSFPLIEDSSVEFGCSKSSCNYSTECTKLACCCRGSLCNGMAGITDVIDPNFSPPSKRTPIGPPGIYTV